MMPFSIMSLLQNATDAVANGPLPSGGAAVSADPGVASPFAALLAEFQSLAVPAEMPGSFENKNDSIEADLGGGLDSGAVPATVATDAKDGSWLNLSSLALLAGLPITPVDSAALQAAPTTIGETTPTSAVVLAESSVVVQGAEQTQTLPSLVTAFTETKSEGVEQSCAGPISQQSAEKPSATDLAKVPSGTLPAPEIPADAPVGLGAVVSIETVTLGRDLSVPTGVPLVAPSVEAPKAGVSIGGPVVSKNPEGLIPVVTSRDNPEGVLPLASSENPEGLLPFGASSDVKSLGGATGNDPQSASLRLSDAVEESPDFGESESSKVPAPLLAGSSSSEEQPQVLPSVSRSVAAPAVSQAEYALATKTMQSKVTETLKVTKEPAVTLVEKQDPLTAVQRSAVFMLNPKTAEPKVVAAFPIPTQVLTGSSTDPVSAAPLQSGAEYTVGSDGQTPESAMPSSASPATVVAPSTDGVSPKALQSSAEYAVVSKGQAAEVTMTSTTPGPATAAPAVDVHSETSVQSAAAYVILSKGTEAQSTVNPDPLGSADVETKLPSREMQEPIPLNSERGSTIPTAALKSSEPESRQSAGVPLLKGSVPPRIVSEDLAPPRAADDSKSKAESTVSPAQGVSVKQGAETPLASLRATANLAPRADAILQASPFVAARSPWFVPVTVSAADAPVGKKEVAKVTFVKAVFSKVLGDAPDDQVTGAADPLKAVSTNPQQDPAGELVKRMIHVSRGNAEVVTKSLNDQPRVAGKAGDGSEQTVAQISSPLKHAEGMKGSGTQLVSRWPLESDEHPTLKTLGEFTIKNVRYLLDQGEKTVRVRLAPESLGELRLEVTSTNHSVSVRMFSANAQVRDALEGQMHGLREALARDGIDLAKATVSAQMSSDQASKGYPGRQTPYSSQDRLPQWASGASRTERNLAPALAGPRVKVHDGSLNLFA